MKRVADLSPEEAAKLAKKILRNHGKQSAALKLLYHSLTENEKNSVALLMLVDRGEEICGDPVTVALAEYAVQINEDESIRQKLNVSRMLRLYRIGLLSHISGKQPHPDAWDDPNQFILNQEAFDALLNQVQGAHSLREFFQAVCRQIGVQAGLLKHKTMDANVPFDEFYYEDRFEKTAEYGAFLAAEELTLDG